MGRYLSAIIGHVLKYYDKSIYGFLIPFLAPLFFPHNDPVYSLLAAYALLPLGILAKPLGAYVFGKWGDRWGRKFCLFITLLGMGCTTGAIGFLPTFEEAGWIGPTLLTCGRLLQNFFAAGESSGGALFLLEHTEKKKRGLMSSLFDASGILGIFLAAFAATLLGGAHWRWLFWFGGLASLAGLFIRRSSEETFPPPQEQRKWEKRDCAAFFAVAAVSGFSYANYYLLSTFLNGFLPLVSKVSLQEALALNTLLLGVDLLLLPLFGWLSLRIEKEKFIFTALFLGALLAVPLFFLLEGADLWIAGSVRITFTVIGVCLAAPYHAWAMETAPAGRRFMVCAMGAALGDRLIGASIPALGLWLYHETGWIASPALLLIASAVLASGALYHLKYQTTGQTKPTETT
ncbi:MAG TPA: hypothetical protein DCE71_02625 [Parachlamydiales bacterium]|nr:hypothetical protein [Parachlamydiales bacterium]